jgi:predicted metal-binding protein
MVKRFLLIIAIGIFLLSSCVPRGQIISIGFIGELNDEGIQRGFDLAVNELNQRGELRVTLSAVFEEGGCNVKKSVTSIQKLIAVDGARAVVVELCQEDIQAIAPIAEANNVPIISLRPNQIGGDYYFQMSRNEELSQPSVFNVLFDRVYGEKPNTEEALAYVAVKAISSAMGESDAFSGNAIKNGLLVVDIEDGVDISSN